MMSYPMSEAEVYQPLLTYIQAKAKGRVTSPYIPTPALLPVAKLCKLALLWQEAGFELEATKLANWLLPLKDFLPLWCSEKEYDEAEGKKLFSYLSRFPACISADYGFDLNILHASRLKAALTLDGNGTSLGVIRVGTVEIRAFGPQSDSFIFGVSGKSRGGWTRTAALAEVWLEMKQQVKEESLQLDFKWVGLRAEQPLSFVFYVKAGSCQIENEILKPKSLRRYQGICQEIRFDDQCKIESRQLQKVELIPLAGEGCFWDCEFLLSFELQPLISQISFIIS
jgi:hypothetical protein